MALLPLANATDDPAERYYADGVTEALNAHLRPYPVAVLAVVRVGDDFHARFSARERRYLFRLVARRAPATPAAGR